MTKLLVFLILGVSLNCQAQEKSIYGFCLTDAVSLSEIRRYLQPIALPSDQLDMMGSCLEALLSEARSTLYESYLQRKYRLNRTYKGNQGAATTELTGTTEGNCRLELLKKRLRARKTDEFSLGKKGKLQRTEEDLSGDTRSQLLLRKGIPGSMRFDQDEVFLTCQGGHNGNYILTVSLNTPDSGISTSLNITQGQLINIGSVVKDLAGKNRTLSINSGIDYSKTTGHDNYDYFLTLP
ncbi:MAG: hypothetical protein A2X86_17385 [Bdellovibrionales bacterium GWA2_49_15]|nr:MAG: hypothetical protein A2X86_17385 [Bdellovibrionales bacterium GWA2_49_15]HAZ13987.1 hypothetical protein [Bdellovibrionales bacterium]